MAEAMTLVAGEKEIAATNTAERLTTTSQIITGMSVKARKANTTVLRIGGSGINAEGYPLEPNESVEFDVIDPSRVWIYGKEKDGVNFLGLMP